MTYWESRFHIVTAEYNEKNDMSKLTQQTEDGTCHRYSQCHIKMPSRAATNDYFDNRLVGRLLFRLIGLNQIMLFIDKIHTIPHSAQCPSNTRNAMKTYSASFTKPPVIKRKQIF